MRQNGSEKRPSEKGGKGSDIKENTGGTKMGRLPKILRYFIISCGALLIDISIVWLLYKELEVNVILSNTIGVVVGFLFSYWMTSGMVFPAARGAGGFLVFFFTFLGGLALADFLIYSGETKWFLAYPEEIRFFMSKGLSTTVPFFVMYFTRKKIYEYMDLQRERGYSAGSRPGIILALLILAVFSIALVYGMREGQYYGSGNDIWGHIYKTQVLVEGIQNGDFYPLYNPDWYNGIQLYRYWPPLSYYALGALYFLVQGNMELAYYLFFGLSVFFSGIPWIVMGAKEKRMVLGTVIALLWFFMPDNIRVFLNEGNLPRMLAIVLVPYLVYFLWSYIRKEKKGSLFWLILVMAALVLSHVMIAAMAGVAAFVFLVIDWFYNKGFARSFWALLAMISGITLTGFWLIPAMSGGLVGMNSTSTAMVLESLAFPMLDQLNPMIRFEDSGRFYFGLGIVILSIFGLIFGSRKGKAGYIFVLLLVVSITPSFLPILMELPASELFWMIRFTTFGYAFYFLSLLEWKEIRRWVTILIVLVLVIDLLPSLNLGRYAVSNARTIQGDVEVLANTTSQRAALMDLSWLGSYPSYELVKGANPVFYTYGWAWQGAETADDIVMLNTSVEQENYLYLFDKAYAMGNDTVTILKEHLGKAGKSKMDLISKASFSGYRLTEETEKLYIFKKETPDSFGVITDYKGIGIGEFAKTLPLFYPSFTVGDSVYLDDYKVEDLLRYHTIFLSGFSYRDKKEAEDLIRQIANRGGKVVVDVTHVPYDTVTQRMNFLDVNVANIAFNQRFPELHYKGKAVLTSDFKEEYDPWQTQYIVSLRHVTGFSMYSDEKLIWAGYNDSPNIQFIGLNLMFHAVDKVDVDLLQLMSQILEVDYKKLPPRETVPLQIEYGPREIIIRSSKDQVNTTLAYQDIFQSDRILRQEGNFLVVDRGVTRITYGYPLGNLGWRVSLVGLFMCLYVLIGHLFYQRKLQHKKNQMERL